MSPVVIGTFTVVGFLILMFLSVPVPFAMAFSGTIGLIFIRGPVVAADLLSNELFNLFINYSFTVGPMFGLMGFLASYSGVGANLYNAVNSFIGHQRGGLAIATQVAGAGFGAICGSPPAATATFSAIAYPEMNKYNYNRAVSALCIASASGLSVLIPPSNNLIVYGLLTENSIGQLFMGGAIPGILVMSINIVLIKWYAWRHPDYLPTSPKYSWKERWEAVKRGGLLEVIFVFILSMGGMLAGYFTPTEAGAVGAFGMLICTLVTRQLDWKKFTSSLLAGARLQAMIYTLLACANVLGKLFVVAKIPQTIGAWVQGLALPGTLIMGIIIIIYFFLGMIVDVMPMVIITMPVFYPIVVDILGYNPLWFGVMLVLLGNLGALTPPMAGGIFLAKGCIDDQDLTLTDMFRNVTPFVVAAFAGVLIVWAFPQVVTWLPGLIYGSF